MAELALQEQVIQAMNNSFEELTIEGGMMSWWNSLDYEHEWSWGAWGSGLDCLDNWESSGPCPWYAVPKDAQWRNSPLNTLTAPSKFKSGLGLWLAFGQ